MAETHPNAYRLEASDKRAEAVRLNGEADQLEAQAEVLDPTPKSVPTKQDIKEKASKELAQTQPDNVVKPKKTGKK